jgi:hypothetical protein
MRKMSVGCLTAALLATGAWARAADALYDAQLVFLKATATRARLQARQSSALGSTFVAVGSFAASWGGDTLTSDGENLRLNGRELPPRDDSVAPAPGGAVSLLAMPRVKTPLGKGGAQVKMGMAEPLQYFEREPDGRFVLRTTTAMPELDFKLNLEQAAAADVLRMEWSYRLVVVGKRTPVAGVSLDVGAPEIRELSGRAETEVQLGQWCFMSLGEGERPPGLVVLVRLMRAR